MKSMDEFTRNQQILIELDRHGRVSVAELAERFAVSTVTIRKDLAALEQRAKLRRIRGGAVATGGSDEGLFDLRVRHSTKAKRAIGAAAARLVSDGDVIALDSSTSCFFLAKELLGQRNLVVVTNGMRTANLFLTQSTAIVVMPGGVLRRAAESVVSPIGDVLAGRGRIDKGFFGLMGLSPELGLLDLVAEEAQMKAHLAAACNEIYGLFDSSKIGRFGMHPFVPAERITALYCDAGMPIKDRQLWRQAEVEVRIVDVQPDPADAARAAAVTR